LKKIKGDLEKKLESEANQYAATEKHNIQLNNLVQQLKDEITKREAEIELGKGKPVI
jgi:thymidylate synthase